MVQISKKHSQVRLTSLLVMNELFVRSHTFRTLLIKRPTFDGFLENIGLIGEHNYHHALPPPKDVAQLLLKKAIEITKQWNDKFGPGYPLLSNAYAFMAENGVDFNDLKVLNAGEAAKLRFERKKKEEENRMKLLQAVQKLDMLEVDIKRNIFQINNCLNLIYPDTFDASNDKEEEFIPSTQSEGDIKVTVSNVVEITKNRDSEDVLSNLKDLYTTLVKENLVNLKKIMSSLSEVSEMSDAELKRSIDIKGNVLSTLSKLAELKINEQKNGNESDSSTDDEDFVEVEPKEGLESVIPIHERALYGLEEETKKTINMVDPSKRACRVLLSSGKLCPRMDAVKCPFHGKIIDRDDEGNMINQEDMEYEKKRLESQIPAWQEPSFLRDIEAATGLDLTLTSTKRKRKKFPGLKDVKKECNPRKRLADRIFSKDSRLKVSCDLDSIDCLIMKKFEDNWSYALNR